jgi:hypothetical protein
MSVVINKSRLNNFANQIWKSAEWLRGKLRDSAFMDSKKAFSDIQKEITDILEKKLTEDLLTRFERSGGIKGLWPGDMFGTEKAILFKGDTLFHAQDSYDRLKAIADKAKNNLEIQKNFVEFLRMLFYYATEGVLGWVSHEDVIKLVKKEEFFKIIWNVAICRPFNRRLIGSLEGYIKQLSAIITDENILSDCNGGRL